MSQKSLLFEMLLTFEMLSIYKPERPLRLFSSYYSCSQSRTKIFRVWCCIQPNERHIQYCFL